jgi:hypothetical protein
MSFLLRASSVGGGSSLQAEACAMQIMRSPCCESFERSSAPTGELQPVLRFEAAFTCLCPGAFCQYPNAREAYVTHCFSKLVSIVTFPHS